ncbi:MAG: glycosyltransferase family 4 protein [Kiritimatiellia bacterium]
MLISINAILLNRIVSGVEGAILHLIQTLAEIGQEQYRFYLPRNCHLALPQRPGVEIVHPALSIPCRCLRIVWEQVLLPLRLRCRRPAVFHAPAYVAPLLAPRPLVLTVYDVIALRHPQFCHPANRFHYHVLLPISVRRADGIIVPSERTKKDLLAALGQPKGRIAVIPLGIDQRFFVSDGERTVRAEGNHCYGSPFILTVSRLEPKKNLSTLLEAFRFLKTEYRIPQKLVVAGAPGWGHAQLSRIVCRYGLQDEVVFEGFVPLERLRTLYQEASLFVFPSLYEGFGLPPLEAAAAGTPVVCSNHGALPEVMNDAALLVNAEDAGELTVAMYRALTDNDLRASLVAKGQVRARSFTWKRSAADTEQFYREVRAAFAKSTVNESK